jgi:hypothetical protein
MEESTNIDAYLEERKKDTKPAPVEVEAFVPFPLLAHFGHLLGCHATLGRSVWWCLVVFGWLNPHPDLQ